jgi:hypothetical protein
MTPRAVISISQQRLSIWQGEVCVYDCAISSAANGLGCVRDTGCTPTGRHYVRAVIGAGSDEATVFKGRRPTGELWSSDLATAYPDRDWILGRILWLCGCESGVNRGGDVDTFRRYIYIHGSPDAGIAGQPASHGCIRVTMRDMLRVFDYLPYGAVVDIQP